MEWQANTIVPALKEEIRTLKGDVQGYKRKYEGEMTKCRELGAERRTLKASSRSAPGVPISQPIACECAWNAACIFRCGTGTGGNEYRVGYNSGKPGRGLWR